VVKTTPPPAPIPWKLIALGGGVAALLIVAGLVMATATRKAEKAAEATVTVTATATATVSVDPKSLLIPRAEAVAPGRALSRAKSRALEWSPDAMLIECRFGPVIAGTLDVSGAGTATLRFGRPAGRLGPGSPVEPDQLVMTLEKGQEQVERRNGPARKGLADPMCPFEDAWRAMVASGVPSTSSVEVTYGTHAKVGRDVWEMRVAEHPELTRLIDGQNCTIVRVPSGRNR